MLLNLKRSVARNGRSTLIFGGKGGEGAGGRARREGGFDRILGHYLSTRNKVRGKRNPLVQVAGSRCFLSSSSSQSRSSHSQTDKITMADETKHYTQDEVAQVRPSTLCFCSVARLADSAPFLLCSTTRRATSCVWDPSFPSFALVALLLNSAPSSYPLAEVHHHRLARLRPLALWQISPWRPGRPPRPRRGRTGRDRGLLRPPQGRGARQACLQEVEDW